MISDQRLARRIAGIAPMLMEQVSVQLRQLDQAIAPAHLRVLAHLRRHSHTVSELSRMNKVSVPSMSSTIQTMVTRGWIVRLPVQDDRRQKRLELTAEGQRTLDRVQNIVAAYMAKAISGLGEGEREQLWAGLDVLYTVFGGNQDVGETDIT
ncbi:MAG: winged helix-turn-helix transcriptional regulator [Anaerolineae bacterium]|nr:winged helix-turn-helix transcriptional regulator [Anaerolineae bacterium]